MKQDKRSYYRPERGNFPPGRTRVGAVLESGLSALFQTLTPWGWNALSWIFIAPGILAPLWASWLFFPTPRMENFDALVLYGLALAVLAGGSAWSEIGLGRALLANARKKPNIRRLELRTFMSVFWLTLLRFGYWGGWLFVSMSLFSWNLFHLSAFVFMILPFFYWMTCHLAILIAVDTELSAAASVRLAFQILYRNFWLSLTGWFLGITLSIAGWQASVLIFVSFPIPLKNAELLTSLFLINAFLAVALAQFLLRPLFLSFLTGLYEQSMYIRKKDVESNINPPEPPEFKF